jgi:hypothetical protein
VKTRAKYVCDHTGCDYATSQLDYMIKHRHSHEMAIPSDGAMVAISGTSASAVELFPSISSPITPRNILASDFMSTDDEMPVIAYGVL